MRLFLKLFNITNVYFQEFVMLKRYSIDDKQHNDFIDIQPLLCSLLSHSSNIKCHANRKTVNRHELENHRYQVTLTNKCIKLFLFCCFSQKYNGKICLRRCVHFSLNVYKIKYLDTVYISLYVCIGNQRHSIFYNTSNVITAYE